MLIEQLKKERIEAMKAKDEIKKNLLGCVISEASKESKEPTDEKIQATIKKFIKNAEQVLIESARYGALTKVGHTQNEIKILESYLPKQLTEREIIAIITALQADAVATEDTLEMKHIMGYFKSHYAGQYDGALVSKIVKEML